MMFGCNTGALLSACLWLVFPVTAVVVVNAVLWWWRDYNVGGTGTARGLYFDEGNECEDGMQQSNGILDGRTTDHIWSHPISHFRPPYAQVALDPSGSYLSSDQKYDVTLDFIVPSTARNIDIGQSVSPSRYCMPLTGLDERQAISWSIFSYSILRVRPCSVLRDPYVRLFIRV